MARFLGGFSGCYGQGFFKPKNRRFEDQIETFHYFFPPVTIGKLFSLLKVQKTLIILGWFHTASFLFHNFLKRGIFHSKITNEPFAEEEYNEGNPIE